MKTLFLKSFLFLLFLAVSVCLFSQCLQYPVSLKQRVEKAAYIVQGTVVSKSSYQDDSGNIYTLNILKVGGWLKNKQSDQQVAVITPGGVLENRAMIVNPSLQLSLLKEYILFLEEETKTKESKTFRKTYPNIKQCISYADAQGAITSENYIYHDLMSEPPQTEKMLFSKIEFLTKQKAVTSEGLLFQPREPVVDNTASVLRTEVVTGFAPTTTNAGTIAAGDFLTITGSGFGAVRGTGTVSFANADDGGATTVTPANSTDYTSWSDASITVKVPRNAGTGVITVTDNGGITHTSASAVTISYAHIAIDNTFLNFASATRQRFYLRNLNGSGGYTFTYNTAFSGNAPAASAFLRALNSWRCATGFNATVSGTTSASTTAANDGTNLVSFDATLPAGVLGRATSYFTASGIPAVCDLANTVWWTTEIDIVFNNPPFAGFTWEFGPAIPSFSEFDFESVALHEMGHAHGLGHIIAPGAVMHYSLSNGAASRTLAARDISGGNAKMAYSTAATCFNPAAAGTPMTSVSGGCSLPLHLLEFSGSRKSTTTNLLTWKTRDEKSNFGFDVERSADGLRFQKINFVPALSSSENNYVVNDFSAGLSKWYYRLKQIDIDGRSTYSPIISINGESRLKLKIWASENGESVYVSSNDASISSLELYNIAGQKLIRANIVNAYTSIPTSHLAKGVYYYRVVSNDGIQSGKLVTGNK